MSAIAACPSRVGTARDYIWNKIARFDLPALVRMNCHYHPTSSIVGTCPRCKTDYCSACTAGFRLNGFETVCLDCGAALAIKRFRAAMNFALLGLLLFMWTCTASHQPAALVPFMGLVGGYFFWATYWGWHTSSLDWASLAQRWDNLPGRKWLGSVLLLGTRLVVATTIGIFREGIRQPWLGAKTLKRWHARMSATDSFAKNI